MSTIRYENVIPKPPKTTESGVSHNVKVQKENIDPHSASRYENVPPQAAPKPSTTSSCMQPPSEAAPKRVPSEFSIQNAAAGIQHTVSVKNTSSLQSQTPREDLQGILNNILLSNATQLFDGSKPFNVYLPKGAKPDENNPIILIGENTKGKRCVIHITHDWKATNVNGKGMGIVAESLAAERTSGPVLTVKSENLYSTPTRSKPAASRPPSAENYAPLAPRTKSASSSTYNHTPGWTDPAGNVPPAYHVLKRPIPDAAPPHDYEEIPFQDRTYDAVLPRPFEEPDQMLTHQRDLIIDVPPQDQHPAAPVVRRITRHDPEALWPRAILDAPAKRQQAPAQEVQPVQRQAAVTKLEDMNPKDFLAKINGGSLPRFFRKRKPSAALLAKISQSMKGSNIRTAAQASAQWVGTNYSPNQYDFSFCDDQANLRTVCRAIDHKGRIWVGSLPDDKNTWSWQRVK